MEDNFWKVVEKDFYSIPVFIKNAFNITGYSNPLSMKNVNDDGLTRIENFVRENGQIIVEERLQNSDAAMDQLLVDIYGDTYKSIPEKFCFRDGDKMLIKELIAHVKQIVDGNGINTGLQKFKVKIIKPRNRRLKGNHGPEIDQKTNDDIQNDNDVTQLKSILVGKIESCLLYHGADEFIDNSILDEMVHVTIENHRVYGNITCIICQSMEKKKKNVHRVSYCPDKKFWVISNFAKHLKSYHKLKPKQKVSEKKDDTKTDDSVIFIEEVQVEIEQPEIATTSNSIANSSSLYQQLAKQIGAMIGAAILNDDQQEPMQFLHRDHELAQLTVARIPGDGNCLLASITHQIFQTPIDSHEHEAATIQLRQNIVEYISQNADSFRFVLQDRIYDIIKKKKHEIDMDVECEHFVRNILSQNHYWCGQESLIAASRLHSVNIIVFDEQGNYYIAGNNKLNYDETILIAYRGTSNGTEIVRCHYDSVTDISAANMYKITSSIESETK